MSGRLTAGFFMVVLAVAVWLYPVATFQLYPDLDFIVKVAPAQGAGIWFLFPLQTALLQLMTLIVLMAGLRKYSGSWLAACLGATATFAGCHQGWLMTSERDQALTHLVLALATVVWLCQQKRAFLVLLPLVLWKAPALALALGLQLLLERQQDAVFYGVSLLSLGLALATGPVPLGGLWLWLVPLAVYLKPELGFLGLIHPFAPVAAGLAVTLALSSWIDERWARLESRSVALKTRLGESEEVEVEVPRRTLLILASAVLWVGAVLPGESRLNREVLIGSHQRGVALEKLFVPRSLEAWIPEFGHLVGLGPGELELGRRLGSLGKESVLVLSPEVRVAALVSTLAGSPLKGWHAQGEPPELYAGPALALRLGDARMLTEEVVGLPAGVEVAGLEPSWEGAHGAAILQPRAQSASSGGSPALPGAPVPGELTPLGVPGLRFQLFRGEQPWGEPVAFPEDLESAFILPTTPGEYTLKLASGEASEPYRSDLPTAAAGLSAELEGGPILELPSRSAVSLEISLKNSSDNAFPLAWVHALSLVPNEELWQAAPLQGVVPARSSLKAKVWLRTPQEEREYPLILRLRLADESELEVPFEPAVTVRSWRRLPARGSWPIPD